MAREKSIGVRSVLTRLFPTRKLERLARETGAVIRKRKVVIREFFLSVVLGFGAGTKRTIAGMRRAFGLATGKRVSRSAFYKRFTPGFVRFLKEIAGQSMDAIAKTEGKLKGVWRAFKDVIITDASVIRLHELLKKRFPACRTNHTDAAAKLHVVLSVVGRGARSVKITSERRNDGRVFQVGPWVRNRLLLFDLGYYRYQLFDCIRRNGGFFLSRLKGNSNPVITAVHRTWRGKSVPLVGEKLQDVLHRLQRKVLDVEVDLTFHRRKYSGKRSRTTRKFRLVGVCDKASGEYHLYVTNIPVETLSAEEVARLYPARWGVELYFKMLKSHYRLDDLPSRKEEFVEALLYSSLITAIVSERLLQALKKILSKEEAERVRDARWAKLFAEQACTILEVLLSSIQEIKSQLRRLERLLRYEAPDPNVSRESLQQQVENGTHVYRPQIHAASA